MQICCSHSAEAFDAAAAAGAAAVVAVAAAAAAGAVAASVCSRPPRFPWNFLQ